MITNLSILTLWVLDQEEALAFYTEKLGFNVHTDARMGEFRWLTVTPPDQPELEIALMEPTGGPGLEAEAAEQIRSLVAKGHMAIGVLGTKDCRRTYEELSARGVEFTQEPNETFYGVDAAFRDNSGNLWRLTQPMENPPREFPAEG
jgi:catechol 2,3-dioxygenase-like lactoylglutathione lyase family enzyme